VSAEGGWNTTTFPCPHVLPDDRNTKCQTYRGGHGWETDLDGPFFGYALLAGLPVSEDGTLERMFRVGLRPLAVRFHAEDLGDTVAVTPQDPRARSIVLQDDAAFNAEAVPCGIFSGRIVVEKATGLPLSCEMVADRTTPAMAWTRTEHRQSDAGAWGFSTAALPDMAPPSGANRFPPRSVDDGLPFGFWDALDAAAGNADIKAMLARPSTWPARFGLSYRPVDTVPGVVRSAEWSWTVELQDGSSSLTFTVTKTGSMLRPYEVAIDGREVNRTLPTSFSVGAMPLGSIWSGSARLLGFSPIGLFCQSTPDDGRFVEFTGFAEALCSVTFARPPSEGPVSPKVSYRSDGSMLIFEANGAVADPYVES
jgi:hypothetical protein